MKYPTKKIISLKDLNLNLLPDYEIYQNANPNWNIGSYLNVKYNYTDAIAFFKLYYPNFVLYRDCVFLEDRFNTGIIDEWFNETNNMKTIEYMSNLYEIKDLFHINSPEKIDTQIIKKLGEVLQFSWQLNLDILFGNSNYKVVCFDEYEENFITFHRQAVNTPNSTHYEYP